MNKTDLEIKSAKWQILAAIIGIIVALFTLYTTMWLPNGREEKKEPTEYKIDRPKEKKDLKDKKEKTVIDNSTTDQKDRREKNITSPNKKRKDKKKYPEDEKLNEWRKIKPENINLKPKSNE